jgi:hypothetical protein
MVKISRLLVLFLVAIFLIHTVTGLSEEVSLACSAEIAFLEERISDLEAQLTAYEKEKNSGMIITGAVITTRSTSSSDEGTTDETPKTGFWSRISSFFSTSRVGHAVKAGAGAGAGAGIVTSNSEDSGKKGSDASASRGSTSKKKGSIGTTDSDSEKLGVSKSFSSKSGDTSCTDSDGGIDYDIKGTVEVVGPYGTQTYEDYCTDYGTSYNIVEYYCDGDEMAETGGAVTPNFYGCEDGAKVPLDADLAPVSGELHLLPDSGEVLLYLVVENNGEHHASIREAKIALYGESSTVAAPGGSEEVVEYAITDGHVGPGEQATIELPYSTFSLDWLDELVALTEVGAGAEVTVVVTLDTDDSITETDETNNVYSATLTDFGSGFFI